MIVIGYPGIGKSTLAGRDNKYIDLESGCFWVDGKRADNWYVAYCQVAEHLSRQGYVVFVSSHEVVRRQLAKSGEDVVVVYPALELRDEWLDRLERRYRESGSKKDYKALMNAKDRYNDNVYEIMNCEIPYKICLVSMKYDLKFLVDNIGNIGNIR